MCAFSQARVAPFALITVSTADPPGLFKQINQQKKEENANYSHNVADHASSLALLSFIDIRRTIGICIQMTCSALVFGCSRCFV